MSRGSEPPRVRLAELIAALSLGIDLGFGQPMEHVLRQCLIALRIAERMGLDERERAAVYYTALLVNIGCHTDAHEQAKWFGDDIAMKADKYTHELRSMRATVSAFRKLGAGRPPIDRLRTAIDFARGGYRDIDRMIEHHAEMARSLAVELRLPSSVVAAIESCYEQWDGKGWPGALGGEAIPIAARIATLAEFVEVAHRSGGVRAALALARSRSGSQFDPALVACLCTDAAGVLPGLEGAGAWDIVIASEPALRLTLAGERLDAALESIAAFVDLKSPSTLGHSRAVADLAAAAAVQCGSPEIDPVILRRAGLVSGFGRLGVSNSIWDKPGPLGPGEWERVRMYPYLTERMLQQSEALAPLGRIAGAVRERMDGSGYPRGLSGGAITVSARLLAAAEAYQTKREPRPHRAALPVAAAADALRTEVRAGRLDADAVEAVLIVAGHRVPRRRDRPAGLTAREAEILVLVTRGLSTRRIAERLVISPKTAGNHIANIYAKIGASNRAAASLFAMRHGLLPEEAFPDIPPAKMG